MPQTSLRNPALILGLLILAGIACNLPGSGPTASPEPPAGAVPSDTPAGPEEPEQPAGPPSETPGHADSHGNSYANT